MIKQELIIDDIVVLSLYHAGFDDYLKDRKIENDFNIEGYYVLYKEQHVESISEDITYNNIKENFYDASNYNNPYISICCYSTEYINIEKSSIISEILKKPKVIREVANFLEEYSGFKLTNNPFALGNTFIYKKSVIDVEITNSEDNIVSIYFKSKIIETCNLTIFLKNNYEVAKILNFSLDEGVPITFLDDGGWEVFDAYFYDQEGNVIYKVAELTWIKSIQMNGDIITNVQTVKLKTLNKTVNLTDSSSQTINVGKSSFSNELDTYNRKNNYLSKKINNIDNFIFLKNDEYEIALEVFKRITQDLKISEIWIFDPYFISANAGFDKTHDILVILSTNLKAIKNFIFVDKHVNNNLEQYKQSIEEISKRFHKNTVNLYRTFINFHDRFIFTFSGEVITGYQIGTSLNSFGENYSTIAKLTTYDAYDIFTTLHKELVINNNSILETI